MPRFALPITLLLVLTACGQVQRLTETVNPGRSLPSVASVPLQELQPGTQTQVALTITPPADGTPIGKVEVQNPAPDLVTATLSGTILTLAVKADAPPQGPIPVAVVVTAGTRRTQVDIPVAIGDLLSREFIRFNAIRAQANLAPVELDIRASMNCWMHGRYRAVNGSLGHTEDASLPYASPAGQACASTSNLSSHYGPATKLAAATPLTDTLFSVPFHAVGMLRAEQQQVGIGLFTKRLPENPSWLWSAGGITSPWSPSDAAGPLIFPGDQATTDLARYNGAEWPDPLTPCPGWSGEQSGLPMIAATRRPGETTASEASLSVDGVDVPVCAYGSTQYVNTTDQAIGYPEGTRGAQEMGRAILKSVGAVFVIPRQPLRPGSTYQVSVKINGEKVEWSFRTAGAMRPQGLLKAEAAMSPANQH